MAETPALLRSASLKSTEPAVLLEKITERFIRQFLKVFHLVVAEKFKLPQGLLVDLHAFARHTLVLFQVPRWRHFSQASIFRPGKSIGVIDGMASIVLS